MNKKYCLKCGKPDKGCDRCDGLKQVVAPRYLGCDYVAMCCPKCNGTGLHKCNPEDLEEKSFEERWLEDEKERG